GEEAEPRGGGGPSRRARDPVLEPAHRARAQPGEHDARLPRLAQDHVQAVLAPDGEQVAHRAAADVDDVLGEDQRAQVVMLLLEPKQRQLQRPAGARGEGGTERRDLRVGVAARRRQEQHPWLALGGEREDEVVQRRVAGLGGEPPATHGEDPARAGHDAYAAVSVREPPSRHTCSATSDTSPPTAWTQYADAAGREATTRASDSPQKCSAAPSPAA